MDLDVLVVDAHSSAVVDDPRAVGWDGMMSRLQKVETSITQATTNLLCVPCILKKCNR